MLWIAVGVEERSGVSIASVVSECAEVWIWLRF